MASDERKITLGELLELLRTTPYERMMESDIRAFFLIEYLLEEYKFARSAHFDGVCEEEEEEEQER